MLPGYYRVFRNQGTGPNPAVCNYGHHDPTLRTRGLVALTRASYPEVHVRLTWEVLHHFLSFVLVLIFKVKMPLSASALLRPWAECSWYPF